MWLFFETFSYPIIEGDIKQLDAKLRAVVVSEKLARKLFGDNWRDEAIGETIEIEDVGEHSIEAIFANMPNNSSIRHEYIYNIKSHIQENQWLLDWGNNGMRGTYLLAQGANQQAANKKINEIYKKSEAFQEGESIRFQAYAENYLYGKFNEQAAAAGGRIEYVRMIGIAALFLLLISCINFVNLATARASKRAKEVGVRKTIGASQNALISQFMIEAGLVTTISIGLAIFLAEILLSSVQNMTEKMLYLQYDQAYFWMGILGISIVTTLLSGAYPSFVLSAFRPVHVLKGKINEHFKNISFRKGLVVVQFVLALLLIVGSIVMQQQIHYVKNKNLGVDKENLIYIPKDQKITEKYDVLRNELLQQEGIAALTSTSFSPIEIHSSTTGVDWPGKRADQSHTEFYMLWAEDNFLETFKIPMVEGSFYLKGATFDTSQLVINQKAVEVMNLENPIGSIIQWWGEPRQIIGVVKDFHIKSLHDPIHPTAILLDKANTWSMFVKPKAGQTEAAIAALGSTFKSVLPDSHLYYEFVDEQYQKHYKSEVLIGKLANYFALISILISCLGLLGLATFLAEQKTKEIGIRKVLGASVSNLIALLSKEFLMLVGIGLLIGAPVSWYLLTDWLQTFAYQVDLKWWMFVAPMAIAILIAGLTVGIQAFRAALSNPIQALKSE